MLKRFSELLENPLWLIGAIIAGFVALTIFFGGMVGWLAGGGLAEAFTGILALGFFFLATRLIRFLSLSINKATADVIAANPHLRVALACANLLASALLTLAVFGG